MPKLPTLPVTPTQLKAIVAAIIAIAAAFGLLQPEATPPAPAPAPITINVDGPDADLVADDPITLDRSARALEADVAADPEAHDFGPGLRGHDTTPVAEHTGPLASPNWPGCSTRMLPRNWSNRTSTVKAIGLHYTAGANRPGLSDMNGLTSYASNASAGVSWHFLIDAEGHCFYSVHVDKKAWTIGNLNSQTVNIEVVGTGKESGYPASAAGERKLGEVVRRIGKTFNIPMRVGAVSNCVVTRPGIITHWQGGSCAGSHHDIKPYDLERVVSKIASAGVTSADRVTCRKLNWWRENGRPGGKAVQNAVRRRDALAARGVRCTPEGPVLAAA